MFLPSTSLSPRQLSPPLVSQPPESFILACLPKTHPAAELQYQSFDEPFLSLRRPNLPPLTVEQEIVQEVATEEIAIDKDPRDEESAEELTDDGGGTNEADADVEDEDTTDEEDGRVRRRRRSRTRSYSEVSFSHPYRPKFSLPLDSRKHAQHITGVR